MNVVNLAKLFANRVLGRASPLEDLMNALAHAGTEASEYCVHSGSSFVENVRDALLASTKGFSVDRANQIKLLLQDKLCQLMALPERHADAVNVYGRHASHEHEPRLFEEANLKAHFDCFYFQPAGLVKACVLLAEDLAEENAVSFLKAAADALIKCDNDPNSVALGFLRKLRILALPALRTKGHLSLVVSDLRQAPA